MFPIKSENIRHLHSHNITVSELKSTSVAMSSQPPRKVIHLPKIRMLGRGSRAPSSGIRITNVKSIKPPDPEFTKQHEEDKLRAQLQKEIEWRSRSCAHKGYECTLPVLSGRQYCGQHILEDPTAPYRQCAHVYGNGERCPLPTPVDQRDHRDQGLCFEHARAAMSARQRSSAPPPPVTTTETLLHQLNHYVRPERTRTTSCASSVSVVSDPADQDQSIPHAVDPFKQIDATSVNASYSASIMECASASESDCDSITLGPDGNCRGGHQEDQSDAEEADCETQPLWRAGVYTAEEAVCEAKTALRSLQAAYVRQMGRLLTLLQQARQQYLRALKAEKEQYCSINAQSRSGPLTVRERRQLRKLKALAGYHRRHGRDAVLARKLHHKRAKAAAGGGTGTGSGGGGGGGGGGGSSRCSFAEGGVRCSAGALPAAKHCLRHVLFDSHQVLFTACGDLRGGVCCREPVARLPLPAAACRYHTNPPPYTLFTLKKENSDSESDSHSSSEGLETEDGGERSASDRAEVVMDCIVPAETMQYVDNTYL